MSICCSILIYVVVQFYPWFNFSLLLFLGMVMYHNEFQTKENKNWTKDKIEPQHKHNRTIEWRKPIFKKNMKYLQSS